MSSERAPLTPPHEADAGEPPSACESCAAAAGSSIDEGVPSGRSRRFGHLRPLGLAAMVTLGVLGVTSFTSAAQRRRSATRSGAEGVSQLAAGHFTPLQRADGEGESRVAGSASVVSGLVSQDAEAPASDEAEAKASMKDGETDPATEGEVAVDGDDLPPLQNAEGGMVDKPHLLWVVLDDVGFNDVGYASSDLGLATPFLDDLSNDGIRFSQLYGQPVCTPSRAAMLTGKLPIHLQLQHWQVVPTEPWGLPTQEVILPQYLRALGYKNLMFGKWHLGHFNNASTPRARGFDHFYGFYSGGVDYFTHVSEESCDTDYHANNTCYYDFWENEVSQTGIGGTHNTELLNNRAIDLVEAHDPATPLFLYMSYPNAHLPLQVPQELYERHNETLGDIPNNDRRDFAALMLNVDEAVANLTIALRRTGLYEQTMMIVCSDNGGLVSDMGGGSNFPLRGEKKYLYEGGVRVHGFMHSPMIMASRRGITYSHLFHMSDWLPTILEGVLATSSHILSKHFPQYSSVDGINHWHALNDARHGTPRKELLLNIDYLDGAGDYLGYYRAAIRVGDLKLVWNEKNISWYTPQVEPDAHIMEIEVMGRVTALYNVTADPYETHDLKKQFPGEMKRMLQKIQQKYLPTMLASNYRGVDPGCFIKWDGDHFVQPWVPDGELSRHGADSVVAARALFEDRFFDATTGAFAAEDMAVRSDPEMARWISYLEQLESEVEPNQRVEGFGQTLGHAAQPSHHQR